MPPAKITIYASSWCGDCFRVRRFCDKYRIPYTWMDIDANPEAEKFVLKTNNGMRSVPTLVFEDGSLLVEPTNAALAEKLGLRNAR